MWTQTRAISSLLAVRRAMGRPGTRRCAFGANDLAYAAPMISIGVVLFMATCGMTGRFTGVFEMWITALPILLFLQIILASRHVLLLWSAPTRRRTGWLNSAFPYLVSLVHLLFSLALAVMWRTWHRGSPNPVVGVNERVHWEQVSSFAEWKAIEASVIFASVCAFLMVILFLFRK